jgi:hypothetical protein
MMGKHCKLFDENLVRNIMISTGLSVMEFMRRNKVADLDDICEFVEVNADEIIETTIEDMNNCEKVDGETDEPPRPNDEWPEGDGETGPKPPLP